MTFSEFKSWLDGFSEAIGDAPTPEQWAKVRAKLGDVMGDHFQQLPLLPQQWQNHRTWMSPPTINPNGSSGNPPYKVFSIMSKNPAGEEIPSC